MAEPFLGEIRQFGFNFAPRGWALCHGQLLSIAQNTALFSILGTTYGGDGQTTFGLPDLRGRAPVHPGFGPGLPSVDLGETGGVESVTLLASQLPPHGHTTRASADLAAGASPAGNLMGAKGRGGVDVYAAATNLTPLAPGAVSSTGSGQAHDNMQPSLTVNFCIAVEGIFPVAELNPEPTMSDTFIGEIKMFAGNFPPRGFAFCDGQLISIAQNTALFALLGTQFGGNGQTNFALPDLRGRVPLHQGQGPGLSDRFVGEALGSEAVALTAAQLPLHSHAQVASTNAASPAYGPSAAPGAAAATAAYYGTGSPQVAMAPTAVDAAGGNQPHDNMAPYGTLSFIIALQGIFPSRN